MLSQVVQLKHEDDSLRTRLHKKGSIFVDRYSREGYSSATSRLVSSFLKLNELVVFFDQYHNKQYPQALKVT